MADPDKNDMAVSINSVAVLIVRALLFWCISVPLIVENSQSPNSPYRTVLTGIHTGSH